MPTVEIDGRQIEVENGTTVIEAAERLGIEIPHYCWHPGLSISGNCRMCLVEIEKSPKLQIACNTRVSDGMVVRTTSDRTRDAQQAVLEFLLINHPIDCPVCDQAGECKLQEYYMDYDRQRGRVALPEKVRKKKAVPVGPLVMLDQERCILCARCTRFLDEITHTHELAIYERGDHAEIRPAPGKTVDNPYAGNIIDICPVGALTSRDFRFRARVWYLQATDSVCGACANGCNIDVYHREGQLYRFLPRANPDVNAYWMCDAGRLSCHDLQGEARLTMALRRETEAFAPAGWEAVLAEVSRRLRAARGVGVIVSARATNEEMHLASRLARALDGRLAGVSWSPPDATGDDFLIKADKNPNGTGLARQGLGDPAALDRLLEATAQGEVDALVVLRSDLVSWLGSARVGAVLEGVGYLVVVDTHGGETAQYADVVLPIGTYVETDGTFTNHAGRVQRLRQAFPPPGDARPGWQVLTDLLRALGERDVPAGAEATFAALAQSCPAFAGLDYEVVGAQGASAAS